MLNPENLNLRINRRTFLKASAGAVASAALAGDKIQENNLKVDTVLSEESLVERLNDRILDNIPFKTDGLLYRSITYHAMRFFGTDHLAAIDNSRKLDVAKWPYKVCGKYAYACVSELGDRFKTVVNEGLMVDKKNFDNTDNWYRLLYVMGHEAYHASGQIMDDNYDENYGILGTIENRSNRFGFASRVQEGPQIRTLLVTKAPHVTYTVPEEFVAQVGGARFLRHMVDKGLTNKPQLDKFFNQPMSYPELFRGVFDYVGRFGAAGPLSVEDSAFGNFLPPTKIDFAHRYSKRQDFYEDFGRAMMQVNPGIHISQENIAALGIVGFSDFAQYDLTKRDVYYGLIYGGGKSDYDVVSGAIDFLNAKRGVK